MGKVRKSVSLGLTGGLVGYHSQQEKNAKAAKKTAAARAQFGYPSPGQPVYGQPVYVTPPAVSEAQAGLLRQQQQAIAQQQWLAQQQFNQQQRESYDRWLAAQPLTCAHCTTQSPAGTATCPECGSRDVAYRPPEPTGPAQPVGWKAKVKKHLS